MAAADGTEARQGVSSQAFTGLCKAARTRRLQGTLTRTGIQIKATTTLTSCKMAQQYHCKTRKNREPCRLTEE